MSGVLAAMAGMGGPAFSVFAGGTFSETHSASANAGAQFKTDGTINQVGVGGTTNKDNWITPTALASVYSAYTIRAHQVSGTAVSGSSLDTDLALTVNREWDLLKVGAGTVTAVLTLTLKDNLGNTVKTGNVNLSATAT